MTKLVTEKHLKLSRRDFIIGSAAIAGGGLALGMNVPFAYAEGTPAGIEVTIAW